MITKILDVIRDVMLSISQSSGREGVGQSTSTDLNGFAPGFFASMWLLRA